LLQFSVTSPYKLKLLRESRGYKFFAELFVLHQSSSVVADLSTAKMNWQVRYFWLGTCGVACVVRKYEAMRRNENCPGRRNTLLSYGATFSQTEGL